MFHTRRTTQVVDIDTELACDKCGLTVSLEDSEGTMEAQEFLRLSLTGGYNSVTLGDMNSFEVDLCQHCMYALLGPFLRQTEQAFTVPADDLRNLPEDQA
jgi:hypothetical protein